MKTIDLIVSILSVIVGILTGMVSYYNIKTRKKNVDEFTDNRTQRKRNAKN